jgi:hypothetical protein
VPANVPVIVAAEHEVDELPAVSVEAPDVPVNEPPLLRQVVALADDAIVASIATIGAVSTMARMNLRFMMMSSP